MSARIVRISGPVVVCDQPECFVMGERVAVGERGLVGEVVRLTSRHCFLQVYEETVGLRLEEPVTGDGTPITVELGPGLVSAIFDGIQRPLTLMRQEGGAFIEPGGSLAALDRNQRWLFEPAVPSGDRLSPGAVIGRVRETRAIEHRILLPPDTQGTLTWVAAMGEYRVDEPIARIRTDTEEEHPLYLMQRWPVRRKRPVRQRLTAGEPLVTGQRVLDTLFPIPKGGTAAMPGGFGTGKTVTQHNLAKWCDADLIVYIGCGERGNEMTGVLTDFPRLRDPRTGKPLIERTVMIANTSNMPVAAREASIYTGITIAEYFRDQGLDVALMADSTSRWAEALREISGRLEEMPAEEGFPAYLPTRIAEFYERAGRVETLGGGEGSVTAIGAVSPPGGDFSEPVTLHTQRFVKAYWVLDKALANARFFPAIHPLDSYSEYATELAPWWENVMASWGSARERLLQILMEAEQVKSIMRIMGEEGLSGRQRRLVVADRLLREGFLQQSANSPKDRYCSPEKQACLLQLLIETVEAMLTDAGAVEDLGQRFRVSRLVRFKDEFGSDEVEALRNGMGEP